METRPANRNVLLGFGVLLFVVFASLAVFAWTQHRAVLQLRSEKLTREEHIKELERQRAELPPSQRDQQAEVERLREGNKDLLRLREEVTRLREQTAVGISETRTNEPGAQVSEIEKLRNENKDLLRLRSEVRQLREQAGEVEVLRAANTRFLQMLQEGNISNLMASVTAVRKQGSLLGIEIISTPPSGAQAYRGALVGNIMPDAPAAQSGLKSGDIIIGLDGRPIASAAQLQVEMLTKKPGETVLLDVMRNDQVVRVPVQTRAWPD